MTFFSHFAVNYGEKELWKIFQRWGRLNELFISRKLNKWGNKFGFVKFYDVKNMERLEKELDSIRIWDMKLHVNVPRYSKGYVSQGAKRNQREMELAQAKARSKPV